jgi:Na+-translocating ferredoxin:NAD+ oxidoreductase RnfD subunit
MPLIPFPNVPNVPGVPAILRSVTVPSAGAILNVILGGVAASIFGPVVWGIFDQAGNEILLPDSFLDIDFKNDVRVSSYPQESGAFASYNKVNTPYDCRVKMAIGADKATRTAFLDQVDAMLKSIDLYTVITPEKTYMNAALQNYSYRRESSSGVSMITVDLWFLEVRTTGTAQFSAVAQPSGASPVSDGQVQTYEVGTANEVAGTPLIIQ